MALFKISKGLSTNLMTNVPNAKEGFAYFTTDDGKFYIDIDGDGSNNTPAVIGNNRIPLNAYTSDILKATSMGTNDNVVYPLLTFEIKDSTKELIEAKYGAIGIKNGTLVIPNVNNNDEILISNTGAGRGIVIDNTDGVGHAIEIIAGKGIKVAQDPTENLELTTKQYVDNAIPTNTSDLTNDSGFITALEVPSDDTKLDKINPTGTGSFSLNRKANTTVGDYSFAEGYRTTASGITSHAEGYGTTASGDCSHAEGYMATASGGDSHAEGSYTTASGGDSHAEGYYTTASGGNSHAEGYYTKASSNDQHVQGKFNIEDSSNTYAHIVGNGTADDARSNAHTIDWSGNAWFAGDVYVGSTSGKNKDEGSKKLATEEYVDNAIPTNTSDLTNDSGFITSSDVPQEVFIATYDTTTWNEIFDAFINDKVCVCVRNSSREVAVLSYINQMPPQAIFTSTTSAYITEFRILGNTWSNQKITIGDVTSYVKKIGDTITGAINCNISSTTSAANNDGAMIYHNQIGENNGIYVGNGDSDGTTLGTTGTANLIFKSWQSIGFVDGCSSTNAGMTMTINTRTGVLRGSQLWGAVWNDYAEFRQGDTIEAGKCVIEVGDDTLKLSSERMQPGANITSDTFGFAIGKTDKCKTPIAVSGRVLAYGYENREEFRKNIGRPVCSGPHGTVSIMTDEEYKEKGYCAIGTISAVPDYEEWGTGKVKVNGRVWIKVF